MTLAHYNALLMGNKQYEHLHETDKKAWEMHDLLVEEYKVEWHVIEQLKQQNLMEWVRKMNVIENIVDEVIKKELIIQ